MDRDIVGPRGGCPPPRLRPGRQDQRQLGLRPSKGFSFVAERKRPPAAGAGSAGWMLRLVGGCMKRQLSDAEMRIGGWARYRAEEWVEKD